MKFRQVFVSYIKWAYIKQGAYQSLINGNSRVDETAGQWQRTAVMCAGERL